MDCLVIQSKPLDQRGSISILQQQLHPLSSNTSRWRVRKRTWNNSERGFSEKRLESLDIYHWAGKESNIKVCRSRDVVMDKYFLPGRVNYNSNLDIPGRAFSPIVTLKESRYGCSGWALGCFGLWPSRLDPPPLFPQLNVLIIN